MGKTIKKMFTLGSGKFPWESGGMMNPKKPDLPAQVTDDANEEARAAAMAELERVRKRRGAASTVVTSPLGLTTDPTTLKKTLG